MSFDTRDTRGNSCITNLSTMSSLIQDSFEPIELEDNKNKTTLPINLTQKKIPVIVIGSDDKQPINMNRLKTYTLRASKKFKDKDKDKKGCMIKINSVNRRFREWSNSGFWKQFMSVLTKIINSFSSSR